MNPNFKNPDPWRWIWANTDNELKTFPPILEFRVVAWSLVSSVGKCGIVRIVSLYNAPIPMISYIFVGQTLSSQCAAICDLGEDFPAWLHVAVHATLMQEGVKGDRASMRTPLAKIVIGRERINEGDM